MAGGRDFNDYTLLSENLRSLQTYELSGFGEGLRIVSGMARGADSLAVTYAKEHEIELIKMPADWDRFGKSAGYRRNKEMADISQGLLAFWDGQSRGTKHMIDIARRQGLNVRVVSY